MGSHVTLPIWVVIILVLLAAWAAVDRILVPSVRWALRRRANRAIEELNTRLKLRIQPFKLTRRQVLIDRLMFDPEVLYAVDEHARETGVPREVAMEKVKRYASEIVPSFSAYAYFRIGTRIARGISQMLYRVRIGYRNDDALAAVDPSSSVIFVINHRSNMDYVLVTYVAATSSALSYAVGEWAQVWGLRGLIRSMGAYFINRDSRETLYRKVLARYVHMATSAGVTQAIFPEGGLSRDGRLRPPKFGLLSYMVSGFDPLGPRDVVFVPVAVNYDRVLEDRMLTSAASTEPGKKPVFGFNAIVLARHVGHHIWMAIRGEWHRFGYTCVSFGEPVSLRQHVTEAGVDFRLLSPEARHAETEKLGNRLMQAVGRVVPALPVSLVSTAMLQADEAPLSLLDIKQRASVLIGELEDRGSYVHIPRADRDYAISVGLRMLTLRHLVVEEDGNYRINPGDRMVLKYYANAIAHLFDEAA
ncbi:MAG: 1-acyl-sn-glycerol-3-phosphate acyltransferase [Bradyrhizobium sp.]|uniref:1-acyl-sn-glycerol-3-phosphate acyltransferase n=1 Tax=Bradyrhizobium sp. TaxID=376 RepID=UPI002A29DA1E|nr:1-acyl-sn-glycerol-3-phosphate acyltransferase [Bradyrhizobium sp.]